MKKRMYLGRQIDTPVTKFDLIPWRGRPITVTLRCSEFTSHCPVTDQPDFAVLEIQYVPDKYIVETKSVKLYLWQFRSAKGFNETLTERICNEFFEQVRPNWVTVVSHFNPRGGISVEARAERSAECLSSRTASTR